jgi:hypothetical protein
MLYPELYLSNKYFVLKNFKGMSHMWLASHVVATRYISNKDNMKLTTFQM